MTVRYKDDECSEILVASAMVGAGSRAKNQVEKGTAALNRCNLNSDAQRIESQK